MELQVNIIERVYDRFGNPINDKILQEGVYKEVDNDKIKEHFYDLEDLSYMYQLKGFGFFVGIHGNYEYQIPLTKENYLKIKSLF